MRDLAVRVDEHDVPAGKSARPERSSRRLHEAIGKWIAERVDRNELVCATPGCCDEVRVGCVSGYTTQKGLGKVIHPKSAAENRIRTQPVSCANTGLKVVVIGVESCARH